MDIQKLLVDTNNLLFAVGISAKRIASINELSRVASSMFVAVFESLFHVRLEGIIRSPQTKEQYIENAQRVIDGLSQQIQTDLKHITGKSIVQGDIKSLSHLISIFVQIVTITSQESRNISPSDGLNGIQKNDHDIISHGSGSITTHESIFEDKNHPFNFELMTDEFHRIHKIDIKKLMNKGHFMLQQEEKLEGARKRREKLRAEKGRYYSAANQKRADVSSRSMQQRWIEDRLRDEKSYKLKRSSEEHVMLRKIYKGLLHKMHEWKLDEAIEIREKVDMTKNEVMSHIKSLQAIFEDRVRILNEHSLECQNDEIREIETHKRMGSELRKAFSARYDNYINDQKNVLHQKRQKILMKRHEARCDLLALLSVEKWHDTLRSSVSNSGKKLTRPKLRTTSA